MTQEQAEAYFRAGEIEDDVNASDETIAARLVAAAREIREWQEAQMPRLSDNALIEKFKALGSTKTFNRLRQGDTAQLRDIEHNWLPAYEGVLRLIEAERDAVAEPVYDDLPFIQPILSDAMRLVRANGIKRLMMIEGDTGHGKTFALRAIKQKLGARAFFVEADEAWARPSAAVGQLLIATQWCDSSDFMISLFAPRLLKLIEHIRGRRVILLDEMHHMSGATLNVIKTLINRTNSVFIGAGMKTLLDKLRASAAQEARQLTHNRLFARHALTGPGIEDARIFLRRKLKLEENAATDKAICRIIEAPGQEGGKPVPVAAHYGGMAFLRNVVDRCNDLGIAKVDGTDLLQAAEYVKRQATGR